MKTMKKCGGNPSRGSHAMARAASAALYNCREAASELFGCESDKVVLTYNATHALNLAIKGLAEKGSHILISDIEHNAVIRPIEKLKREYGIEYSCFNSDSNIEEEILKLARHDTKCIVSTLCSNVTGKRVDLGALSRASRRLKLPLIVDASQAAGHFKINFEKTPFDILCAPAHKSLFGIQGCGFAIFTDGRARESFIEGGSGSESLNPEMPARLPERFEAGTPAVASIVSLRYGIEYINALRIEFVSEKLGMLTKEMSARLASIKGVSLLAADEGIVSFTFGNVPSSKLSCELDKYGICTRSGLHCAPSAHKKLGTLDIGAVRISFSCFNSIRDTDAVYKAMKKIEKTGL
jgi:selenocysteine lyase/cysteine desulfurase